MERKPRKTSRIFRRLFLSYILIIAISMGIYAIFLIYQSRQISRTQAERENGILMRAAQEVVEDRVNSAGEVVRALRYSRVMQNLYMSARTGDSMGTYEDYVVQQELRSVMSLHGTAIYGITVFIDGDEKAYSAGGPIFLQEPFTMPGRELPILELDSMAELFGFKDNERYYFSKEGLLFCDTYTYQSGVSIGVCCVFIDEQELRRALDKVLGDTHGVRLVLGGETLMEEGVMAGEPSLTSDSDVFPGLTYELMAPAPMPLGGSFFLYGMLVILGIAAVFFIWLAYWESKRYYRPIDYLGSIVESEKPEAVKEGPLSGAYEMDGIISGIQSLIGEKNRYRERMLTIVPYAGAGALRSIAEGREGTEQLRVLADEDFLDLKRPYYVVSMVNFAYEGKRPAEDHLRERLDEVFRQVAQTWSDEESKLSWYFRDESDVYLIVNSDEQEQQDDLFYNLHRQISAALSPEHILVSMGVDRTRDEIEELGEACESAMAALDGVLCDGRGDIFFARDTVREHVEYYFPEGFREQLRSVLERGDRDGVHQLLFDIYKKNLDLAAAPEVYRALLDEFHPALMRTLRELTGPHTVHLNIRKPDGLMTLQEIFDYYDAALLSAIELMEEVREDADGDARLDEQIIGYVEEHFTDPDISLQLLSDKFDVSNKYLLLLFKQRYGMTYLQYLQSKRIHLAAELIRRGELSLTEIGERTGYGSQLTFRRNFRSVMGVNPSEYAARQ